MTTVPPHRSAPSDPLYEGLADAALAQGQIVGACGVLAVPDVILVEGHANGLTAPQTFILVRPDGRYVAFFREPGRSAA